jgi:hypothetical protein
LNVEPEKDIESLRWVFTEIDPLHPLMIARGDFNLDAVKPNLDLVQRSLAGPGGKFHLVRLTEPDRGKTTFFGASSPYLLGGEVKHQVVDGLAHANARQSNLSGDDLRRLLTRTDRDQLLWLAVSVRRLGTIPTLAGEQEKLLRPILAHADTVSGGLKFKDGLHWHFVVETHGPASAEILEKNLRNTCAGAKQALPMVPRDADPNRWLLLKLMASATFTRTEARLELNGKIAAGDFK